MRFIANFTPYFGPKRCIYTVFCKVFTTFLSLAGFSSAPTSIFAHLHLNVLLLCTIDLVEKCHTLQSGQLVTSGDCVNLSKLKYKFVLLACFNHLGEPCSSFIIPFILRAIIRICIQHGQTAEFVNGAPENF